MSPKTFIANILNNETFLLLIFSDINHKKKKEYLPPQLGRIKWLEISEIV